METKLAKLTAAYRAGDFIGALRIAAKFPQLGEQKKAITTAWAAHQNPDFYRELGFIPEALVTVGIKAIAERYGLNPA